ncbi:helix-turn-helix domain-containing protein [Sphingopyxis sp.]|uniref:helix-turn-helix domain-containing protein n=1 Tax=Sphingopyxis sp. TaxID=1908224 RepID=UPI003F6F3F11
MTANTAPWSGSIMLGTGWALIDARIGTSRPHSHLAHQISLAVEQDLEISGDADMTVPTGHAVALASHVPHRMGPQGAMVRSFYLDPLFRAGTRMSGGSAPILLPPTEAAGLGAIANAEDARRWASSYLDRSHGHPVDARLSAALTNPDDLSSARALADVACLSPSRLREIVSRDFGVPPAKLLQWLQLQRALRALADGGGLADAAAAGGFADQSHFTRRCAQWLGVTPSAGLAGFAVEIML